MEVRKGTPLYPENLKILKGKNIMAIYHFSVKNISRSDGRSVVACAAYRSGEKLIDERQGKEQDYTRKSGVEFKKIYAPIHTDQQLLERNQLWNAVEKIETRKNSQLAREFEIAFPCELKQDQREQLLNDLCEKIVKRHNVIVDAAIHAPHTAIGSDERNYHAHILLTTRSINDHGQLEKKTREFNDHGKEQIEYWREEFANLCNYHLKLAGSVERVDHRSYKARGSELEPTQHEGPKATQLKRQGIATEITIKNENIRLRNIDRLIEMQLDQQICASENFVDQIKQEISIKKSLEKQYIDLIEKRINEDHLQEISEISNFLNEKDNEIEQLEKEIPLFFRKKWTRNINNLIAQYNEKLEVKKSILNLSISEKNERYSNELTEENKLLNLARNYSGIESQINNFIFDQSVIDQHIKSLHDEAGTIGARKSLRYLREQENLVFIEDNYGNPYLSPYDNTPEQIRRYNARKKIDDARNRMEYSERAERARLYEEIKHSDATRELERSLRESLQERRNIAERKEISKELPIQQQEDVQFFKKEAVQPKSSYENPEKDKNISENRRDDDYTPF